MAQLGQVLCFSMGLLTLGASLTFYLIFVVAGRNALTNSGERIVASLPSLFLLMVTAVFFWIGLMQNLGFGF